MSAPATTARLKVPLDDWAVLTPETPVADALAALEATSRRAAVVEHRLGYPIGVITMDALRGRDGTPPGPDATISDVMDWECVRCDPSADDRTTLHAYHEAAWTSLRRRHPGAPTTHTGRRAQR